MTNYLGIDYGLSHVGLALSLGALSTPLASLKNSNLILAQIKKLVNLHKVTTIVIGMPEGKLEQEVKHFAKAVEQATDQQVVLHPETLSSYEAVSALKAVGAKRHKLQNEHAYSACLILDDYLDVLN